MQDPTTPSHEEIAEAFKVALMKTNGGVSIEMILEKSKRLLDEKSQNELRLTLEEEARQFFIRQELENKSRR